MRAYISFIGIAALPGAAAGAGLSLALACDLRIMARSAFLTTAFAKVGFCGDYGGTYFLTRDRIVAAETRDGRIEADAFVVSLGTGSRRLAAPLGLDVPVYPIKGYSITVPIAVAPA